MIEFLSTCLSKRLIVANIGLQAQLKLSRSVLSSLRCIHQQSVRHSKDLGNNCRVDNQKAIMDNPDETSEKSDKTINTKHHHVFLYGTLKKNEPNHSLLLDTKDGVSIYLGTARTLQKWPLVIASRYNIPYLLHCEGTGKQVIGEVYEVNNIILEELDKLECHPRYYERTEVQTEFLHNNEISVCWTYFLKKYSPHLLDLPFFENYSSNGPHGLKYVERSVRLNDYDVKPEVYLD